MTLHRRLCANIPVARKFILSAATRFTSRVSARGGVEHGKFSIVFSRGASRRRSTHRTDASSGVGLCATRIFGVGVSHTGWPRALPPSRAAARADDARKSRRRIQVRVLQPNHLRNHYPRSLRRTARWCYGVVAGLRKRHSPRRSERVGFAPGCAAGGFIDLRARRGASTFGECGPRAPLVSRCLRSCDDWLWFLNFVLLLALDAFPLRRHGQRERACAAHARAVAHAR